MANLSIDPEDPLANLRSLHPTYSDLELQEAQDNLRDYFDLAWEMFARLEREEPEKFKELIEELRARMPATPVEPAPKAKDNKAGIMWPSQYL